MDSTSQELYKAIVKSYKGGQREVAHALWVLTKDHFRVTFTTKKLILFSKRSPTEGYDVTTPAEIKNVMSNTLRKHYYAVAYSVFQDAFNDDLELINEKYIDVALSLLKIAQRLSSGSFKTPVAKEFCEMLLCH
jgi:hypothetical protein